MPQLTYTDKCYVSPFWFLFTCFRLGQVHCLLFFYTYPSNNSGCHGEKNVREWERKDKEMKKEKKIENEGGKEVFLTRREWRQWCVINSDISLAVRWHVEVAISIGKGKKKNRRNGERKGKEKREKGRGNGYVWRRRKVGERKVKK